MNRRGVLVLVFILICSPLIIPLSRHATADALQYDDFTILANGSIYAPYSTNPPVTTSDNATYTLTRNVTLSQWIRIERNNTVLDGAGYILTNEQPALAGLELEGVSDVTVRNLSFRNSGGLYVGSASDCFLVANNFTNCQSSFYIEYSSNVTLSQNTMKNASFGYVGGNSINHYLHSIDTSNTVDGKPVYYLTNQEGLTINSTLFPEIGFLALVNSTEITVEGLRLANSTTALLLAFTNNSKIMDNVFDDNHFGISAVSSSSNLVCANELVGDVISLEFDVSCCNNTITGNRVGGTGGMGLTNQSNYNTVSFNNVSGFEGGIFLASFCSNNVFVGNIIENCSGEGLELIQSQNNTFIQNTIMNTTRALRLEQAETCNNTFYDNNFENNKQPFLIIGTIGSNIWDNGLEGNYWSNYNGTDGNQDGIGDTPYIIDANNTDHYPLMGTFQSFNVSAWNISSHQFEEVDVISNSTIEHLEFFFNMESLQYPWEILLIVHGQIGTTGFCRITFPNNLLNSSSYPTYVAGYSTLNRIVESNGTHTTLYFTFNQPLSDYNISILPEFPFLLIPLFMIATLLAVFVHSKKHSELVR
jgi:parallel beta-helix repeat protein